jgi:hypothetical protein
MTVVLKTFTQDLSALTLNTSFTFTTNFAASCQLGEVLITVKPSTVDLSDGNTVRLTPVTHGIQETIEIWLKSSAGADFDVRLDAVSGNGRSHIVYVPSGFVFINSGSEIKIIVSNRYQFGTIFGSVLANTI